MINCGVQLFSDSCQIVAVSDAFAVIDQRHFTTSQHEQAIPWLESLKTRYDEPVQWFFDEQNLYTYKQTAIMLTCIQDDHETFMIQHRKLANLMQFFFEWMAQEATFFPAPDQAWILASAVRLFDDDERRACYIDDLPF
jgi:hypothetical protein